MIHLPLAVVALATSSAIDLQGEIDALRSAIADVRTETNQSSTAADRAAYVRAIVKDVLLDAHDRVSLRDAGTAPWNTIESENGDFALNLSIYMQTDWLFNKTDEQNSTWGFSTQRSRITFSGHLFDESYTYFMRIQNGENGWGTEGAFMQKSFDDGWFVQGGLLFPMFSLEEAISSDQELGVNVSFLSGQFDEEISSGVQVGWQGERQRFWFYYGNGFAQPFIDVMTNQRQGIMTRLECKPFGDWSDLYSYNPHPNSTEEGLLFGVAAAYDWGTYDNPTSGAYVAGTTFRATADVSYQLPGFSTVFSAYYQDVDTPIASFGGDRWAFVGQLTGFVTPNVQLYGRGEWGTVLDSDTDDISLLTLGASYYPFESKNVKISLEVMRFFNGTTNWNLDGDPGVKATDEQQTLIRSQLQISF